MLCLLFKDNFMAEIILTFLPATGLVDGYRGIKKNFPYFT